MTSRTCIQSLTQTKQWKLDLLLQIPVLVDSITDEGEFVGRTQWDAPDVDPMVFLSKSEDGSAEPLAVGQMRLCSVDGTLLFDIEAHPVD